MDDLIERLREWCRDWDGSEMADAAETRTTVDCRTMREAATLIESLRSDNAAMREALEAISVDDCMDPWGLARTTLSRIQERDNG